MSVSTSEHAELASQLSTRTHLSAAETRSQRLARETLATLSPEEREALRAYFVAHHTHRDLSEY